MTVGRLVVGNNLGNSFIRTGKCDWRTVPLVTDAEFDRLVSECAPRQLVVVAVYSSRHPEATPCDAMVEEIFYGINYRSVGLIKKCFILRHQLPGPEVCTLWG